MIILPLAKDVYSQIMITYNLYYTIMLPLAKDVYCQNMIWQYLSQSHQLNMPPFRNSSEQITVTIRINLVDLIGVVRSDDKSY